MRVNEVTLRLFNAAIPYIEKESLLDFAEVNKVAAKLGYFVPEELCVSSVLVWLNTQKVDYNKSFYKTWNDVISKSRFELFIDQIVHYMSTYGTNFEGEDYLPHDGIEAISFTDMKVIKAIDRDEVTESVMTMLGSGIALDGETINDLIFLIKELKTAFTPADIKNREAKMILCKEFNVFPESSEEFVRFLIDMFTGRSMVVKNDATIRMIKENQIDVSPFIVTFGVKKLSAVFNRYKPLFLAMRNTPGNKAIINKLSKYSKTNHVPYRKKYFETLLTDPSQAKLDKLDEMLSKLNNYKKVVLLQAISVRKKNLSTKAYLIRNQKLYIKTVEDSKLSTYVEGLYYEMYTKIFKSLVKSMAKKATTVKIPVGLNITAPTSEKSFIGNIPIGTSLDLADKNAMVGIYWKNSDGAVDLDLSYVDISGNKIGWNSSYYNGNKSVIYSGDITNAQNGANEFIYGENGFGENACIFKVNAYSANPEYKFKMFIATEVYEPRRRYENKNMVDPNNIVFQVDLESDRKENTLGLVVNNKFVFANVSTGNSKVSHGQRTEYIEYVKNTVDCYVYLNDILKEAGFEFVEEEAEIDLTELNKATLIELFA